MVNWHPFFGTLWKVQLKDSKRSSCEFDDSTCDLSSSPLFFFLWLTLHQGPTRAVFAPRPHSLRVNEQRPETPWFCKMLSFYTIFFFKSCDAVGTEKWSPWNWSWEIYLWVPNMFICIKCLDHAQFHSMLQLYNRLYKFRIWNPRPAWQKKTCKLTKKIQEKKTAHCPPSQSLPLFGTSQSSDQCWS